MSYRSLGNPFDADTDLQHGPACNCPICVFKREPEASRYECTESQMTERLERAVFDGAATTADASPVFAASAAKREPFATPDDVMDRAVESAIVRGLFGHNDMSRRNFLGLVGGSTVAGILGTMLPMDAIKAAVKEEIGGPKRPSSRSASCRSPARRRSSWPIHSASMKSTASMST